ncbi:MULTISPECIES: WXG100 family type VII secretion target [unclassified Nocardioides]|uniref:WXG100 family type VII secretion target n=1 Tax=unclassified Nocardioides TaxID=2615069 RepID=UPI00249A7B37|nr:hypothetical protein [Nocardioides sp. LHD-245]WGX96279.1 hypothetical protein QJ852_24430 [Nocardioides sp. L-11A]
MAVEFGHAEGALGKVADLVITAKQDLGKQAQTMEGQLESMRQEWVGTAGLSFDNLKNAWLEKHKVVTTALDRFHASLTETEKDNVAVDEQAGSEMVNLLNRLGQQ